MSLTAIHCQRCKNVYPSNVENCPHCGSRGPQGRRTCRLKVLAVLIFLVALSLAVYQLIHARGGW